MTRTDPLADLLRIASPATGPSPRHDPDLPRELDGLYRRNGFFAFESALEVFPLGVSEASYSVTEWNAPGSWRAHYRDLAPRGWCFAQDLFGVQFIIDDKIHAFDPETAAVGTVADDIAGWAEKILDDFAVMTGHPLAHAWQAEHGPLPKLSRLVPITPFVLGGAYAVDNLMVMNAMEAMRLRAGIALQIKDLPDGTPVRFEVR